MSADPGKNVRVYCYADSGPFVWYGAAGDRTEVLDGFGESNIYEVPEDLWTAYCAATEAERKAESALEAFIDALDQ